VLSLRRRWDHDSHNGSGRTLKRDSRQAEFSPVSLGDFRRLEMTESPRRGPGGIIRFPDRPALTGSWLTNQILADSRFAVSLARRGGDNPHPLPIRAECFLLVLLCVLSFLCRCPSAFSS